MSCEPPEPGLPDAVYATFQNCNASDCSAESCGSVSIGYADWDWMTDSELYGDPEYCHSWTWFINPPSNENAGLMQGWENTTKGSLKYHSDVTGDQLLAY